MPATSKPLRLLEARSSRPVPGCPMSVLIRVVALVVTVVVPPVASADVPRTEGFEQSERERAEFRQVIVKARALLAQIKNPRFCGPLEEVEATERFVEHLEWAYANRLPCPVTRPKPAR